MLLLVLPAACANGSGEPAGVVLGVGSTTEQRVLAALTVVAGRRHDVPVEVRTDLGGTVALRREAVRGSIDAYWDYTGAAWALGLGEHAPPADPVESYQRVRQADEALGLVWLDPSEANATLALFVRAEDLPPQGEPRGLTWLAGVLSGGEARLCADEDFVERPGGLDALAEAYAIGRERLVVVAAGEDEAVERVTAGDCFTGLATATSGKAREAGLVPVHDDLRVFPAFVVAPVARAEVLERWPALRAVLSEVTRRLGTDALAVLNARVEAGEEPEQVAAGFFEETEA